MKYEFILTLRKEHSVATLCRVFGVSRSAFYSWLNGKRPREEKGNRVLEEIEAVHDQHRGHSGAVKTWRVLKNNGVECGKHQVPRIRQQNGIVAKRRRRFVITTKSKPSLRHAANLLRRQFYQPAPESGLGWRRNVYTDEGRTLVSGSTY